MNIFMERSSCESFSLFTWAVLEKIKVIVLNSQLPPHVPIPYKEVSKVFSKTAHSY